MANLFSVAVLFCGMALIEPTISVNDSTAWADNWQASFKKALKNGGAIVESEAMAKQGSQLILEHRANDRFVPASIIKLATVSAALHLIGRDHRFKTEFYLTANGMLGVKGFGDPFLVSEELQIIAKKLRPLLGQLSGIQLDDSFFEPNIVVDGAGNSLNPYDASYGALLANFNTVNINKHRNGKVSSAETQTPLTEVAETAGRKLAPGSHRINIGQNRTRGLSYVAQLLRAMLLREGIKIGTGLSFELIPKNSKLIYTHSSSKTVAALAQDLLEYSTNFLANQIFLLCGATVYGPPASVAKGRQALAKFLESEVGWKDFSVVEGAGLSRMNKVSPKQMMVLLDYFSDNRDLLPLEHKRYRAKTGSLRGVNTLAGYLALPSGDSFRYVIMVNDNVPHNYRFTLADKLYRGLINRRSANE